MKALMRHLLFYVLLIGGINIQGFSQDQQMTKDSTEEEMARSGTDRQKEALSLNGQQEEQMYEVNLKYIKEMQEIRSEGRSLSTISRLKAMSGRMDEDVRAILNDDQYKEYLKMKEERQKEMKKRMKSSRGSG